MDGIEGGVDTAMSSSRTSRDRESSCKCHICLQIRTSDSPRSTGACFIIFFHTTNNNTVLLLVVWKKIMKQALVLLGYVLGQACRHLKVRTKIRKSPKIG